MSAHFQTERRRTKRVRGPVDALHIPHKGAFFLAGVWIVALLCTPDLAPASTKTYDCSTTAGWITIDSKGQPTSDTQLSAADGQVVFEYPRTEARVLVHHGVALRGFEKLVLRVRSKESATIGVSMEDSDKARFFALGTVAAGDWETLEFSPGDFQIGDDSPVKKDRMDADLLGAAYAIIDIAFFMGGSGRNTLEVDSVEITSREAAVNKGTRGVTDEKERSQNDPHEGDVVVRTTGTPSDTGE